MDIVEMYVNGASITDITNLSGIPLSNVRRQLKNSGVLRTRAESIRLAASQGKLSKRKGVSRPPFSKEWRENISKSRTGVGKGLSYRKNGYVEYTMGENKGRTEHSVVMEKIMGRRLFSNECIHHIDKNRHNNDPKNLVVMTKREHSRLHANETSADGKLFNGITTTYGNRKLTDSQVTEIFNSNKSCKYLCAKYNVSLSCVEKIKSQRTWKHITKKEQ